VRRLLFDATDRSGDRSLLDWKCHEMVRDSQGEKTHTKGFVWLRKSRDDSAESPLQYDAINVKTARWDVFSLMQRIDREIDPYGKGNVTKWLVTARGKIHTQRDLCGYVKAETTQRVVFTI